MSSDWLNIPGAVEAVKAQLAGSGIPLEVRISQICQDFASQNNGNEGLRITEERKVYSSDAEGTVFREIDREVIFYKYVQVSDKIHWSFNVVVPIECKHRDNTHIIGFPYEKFQYSDASTPMTGPIGSGILEQLRFSYPDELLEEPVSVPSLMQINFDAQSQKVGAIKRSDERLIYNAAGSLYDYVKANVPPMPTKMDTDDLRFFSELIDTSYAKNTHPWHMQRFWRFSKDDILPSQDDIFHTYNKMRYSERDISLSTDIYFPILCIDSPLYMVEFAKDHSISNIIRKEFLLSSITIGNWPEQTPHYFVNIDKELLITVTTPEYLFEMLNIVFGWVLGLSKSIQDNAEIITKAPLESAAYEYLLQIARGENVKLWAGIR